MNVPVPLIIGLGNPILGDDGVGWVIAREAAAEATRRGLPTELDCLSLGGLSLMERLDGYRHVILIDSLITDHPYVGRVTSFPLESLPDPSAGHSASAHDATLSTALAAGRRMGMSLPDWVHVVAVGIAEATTFSEEISAPVTAAVPEAVRRTLELLESVTMKQEVCS